MSQAADLVAYVLGPTSDEADAAFVLDRAIQLEVDPLECCACQFPLTEALVMRRVAEWLGLTFADTVAAGGKPPVQVTRLDGLGDCRTVRVSLPDGERIYYAPRFAAALSLKAHIGSHPELAARMHVVTATAIRRTLAGALRESLVDSARQRLARSWPLSSAHMDLTLPARISFAAFAALVLAATVLAPFLYKPLFVPLVAVFLLAPAALRLIAAAAPLPQRVPVALLGDADLPVYSVLIPLRDEANMVPMLAAAMRALDYPPEKLDVKFVVEARSAATVAAVEAYRDDPRFELLLVPDCAPRTKPKALNYALPFLRGRHVVVYDAEDIPEPGQLRLAASSFAADPGLDCIQAELVIDNASENWLTALFAGEYAGQFGLVLPLLARWRLPMPLGGTSNHFNTAALREVGGWDSFNVTEDADLGMRLARLRYRCATLPSHTREEAPIRLSAWMAQRTRWMKGWMQTFVVHNRDPLRLLRDAGWKGFLAFEVYVGSMILSALLHTAFVVSVTWSMVIGDRGYFPNDPWGWFNVAVLVLGYGSAFSVAIGGLVRLGQARLIAAQLLLPFYWVLHTIAALRAGYELFTRPYFWAKTAHGTTRMHREVAPPTKANRFSLPVSIRLPSAVRAWQSHAAGDSKAPARAAPGRPPSRLQQLPA